MVGRGRIPDTEVLLGFKRFKKAGFRTDRGKCKACGKERSWQTTDLRQHLMRCKSYIQGKGKEGEEEVALEQQKLVVPVIGTLMMKVLQDQMAEAVILDSLPLDAFEDKKHLAPILKRFYPTVKPPTSKDIVRIHLPDVYKRTQNEVLNHIKNATLLNLITDESNNIKRQRVQNLCVNIPGHGAFYWDSEIINGDTCDGEWHADWLDHRFQTISGGNTSLINSVSMDTCPTQNKASRILSARPPYKHVFFVPCTSHGLQLLIKDVIAIPWISERVKQAQAIVTAFTGTPKQLAILRDIMQSTLGSVYSFTLSVITRWGTQTAMIKSVRRAYPALLKYANSIPDDASKEIRDVVPTIDNGQFWVDLDFVFDLLEPLDKAIKKSESDTATLQYVVPMWKDCRRHLQRMLTSRTDAVDYQQWEAQIFKARFLRQTGDIHIVAYLLDPTTLGDDDIPFYTAAEVTGILHNFFKRQGIDNQYGMTQTLEFRYREERFHNGHFIWEYKHNMRTFWKVARSIAPAIAPIAIRLASTPCNSVPSERSFSILKLLHNKLRNRLKADKVNMLQFIYINRRVIERIKADLATEGELIELEDALMSVGEDHTKNPELNEVVDEVEYVNDGEDEDEEDTVMVEKFEGIT